MRALTYGFLGDYARCIELVRTTLAQLRPGESVIHLLHGVQVAIEALYYSGRWSEIIDFLPVLEGAWEDVQNDAASALPVRFAYWYLLMIALAREDRAAAQKAAAVVERFSSRWDAATRACYAALREDNPGSLTVDVLCVESKYSAIDPLMFLNERGIPAPGELIAHLQAPPLALPHHAIRSLEIAEALAAEDWARLSTAIEEAEAHGLIVHAARMRIVLAQRTSDRTHLEHARPVLEQLGDRQFLRRLEEVAAALGEEEKLP
jgi:hypothetical protein